MKFSTSLILFFILLFQHTNLNAQDSSKACKVLFASISGEYTGDCKKGLAHGKGESKGLFRYVGDFKYGYPNGKGILYTGNSYFEGRFQDGLKEGKGEMHFPGVNIADSIISGYWSGDMYRGKSYKTYQTDAVSKFDRVEISPSDVSGNRITIEISTTTVIQDRSSNMPHSVVSLVELTSMKNNSLLKQLSFFETPLKSTWEFEITQFPITLRGVLSNGQDFHLELYKSAYWTFRIFINK